MAKQDSSPEPRTNSSSDPQPESERLPAWIRATYSSVLGAILALFIISMFVCVVLLLLGQFGLVTFSGEEGFLADAFSLPTASEDSLTATALASSGDSLSLTATAEALASAGDTLSLTATAEVRATDDSLALTATAASMATEDSRSQTATAQAVATEDSRSQTATAQALSRTGTAEGAQAQPSPTPSGPTATPVIIAFETLTATPSNTPPPTSSPSATPIPPNPTPTGTPSATPTPTATPTPAGPTATPVLLLFPTLTATASATPTGPPPTPAIIAFPTLTPTPGAGTATPTPTPTPTPISVQIVPPPSGPPGLPSGTLTLISPRGLDVPSYGPTTFVWEWVGEPIPPQFGFEVYVWLPGEFQAGVHDAVRDNLQAGDLQQVSPTRYQLNVTDIRFARGVLGRTGNYQWTVGIVQVSPTYETFGLHPPPAMFRYENPN